jgi:acyl carrier protein
MSQDIFLIKLAEILQVGRQDVNEQFKLTSDNWDSLEVVAAIAAIDEQFDITLPTEELTECSSVGDLLKLIRRTQGPPP